MKNLMSILFLLISIPAFAQSRPGTGPDGPKYGSIEVATSELLLEVSSNSKKCGQGKNKFRSLISLYTYAAVRTALQGDKACADGKISQEVACLFSGEEILEHLKIITESKEAVSYIKKEDKVTDKQAKDVLSFYKSLVPILEKKK